MRQMTYTALVLALGAFGFAACGGDEMAPVVEPPAVKRELPQPVVQMVAPTAVAAGDLVTIFGSGFADGQVGQTRLHITGVYQTTDGNIEQVDLQITPRFLNQGMLEWTFGPNIPFSSRDQTGTFRGTVQATNVAFDGEEKVAQAVSTQMQVNQAVSTQMQVKPSILIRHFRPMTAGCQVGIEATTADTPFYIELEAVGLKAGTGLAPMRFAYTFMREHFSVEGYFNGELGVDPANLMPQSGAATVVDEVEGATSRLGNGVPSDVAVVPGALDARSIAGFVSKPENFFGLTQIKTGQLANEAANYFDASLIVLAVDSTGASITRRLSLRVWAAVEINYDGNHRVARSFDPVPVSSCIPGGDIGRDVTYNEVSSETRARDLKVKADISGSFNAFVARVDAAFGFEVTTAVSSSEAQNLSISGFIIPQQFAVFYRQTLQLERTAQLSLHGACGNVTPLGEIVVTDWVWSPDLAKGNACLPLPTSNLPAGEVFEP
ncbi:MAG: hypothetical protein JRH20_17310 [Deltaproteobacteria bacterium]|nr:hypothetical protein [Deltaproteobacteria bacterium]